MTKDSKDSKENRRTIENVSQKIKETRFGDVTFFFCFFAVICMKLGNSSTHCEIKHLCKAYSLLFFT